MAGPVLCVACASLPIKATKIAVKFRRCPECGFRAGVTSYGSFFRPDVQLWLPSKLVFVAGAVAVGLFMVAFTLLVGRRNDPQPQMAVNLNPPARDVFEGVDVVQPPPPVVQPLDPVDGPVSPELFQVPEIGLKEIEPKHAKNDLRDLIGQIRRENADKQDGFLLAQMERQPELRGLPYILGDDCRLRMKDARSLTEAVRDVRSNLDNARNLMGGLRGQAVWQQFGVNQGNEKAMLAALSQILAVEETHLRKPFGQNLRDFKSPHTGVVLAKLAIFDPNEEVRKEAIAGLRHRKNEEYVDVLLEGMRYPMPAVVERSANAILAMKRKDMLRILPLIGDLMKAPAPADPVVQHVDGEDVHVVREVVRINHHRNCFLCHAPASGNAFEVAALVPVPGEPIPESSRMYYGNHFQRDSLAVRADTTYLRQDFSVLMPVDNAKPWPDKQRFDFLVRTRVVDGDELADLQRAIAARPRDYRSETQKQAERVLREITGDRGVPLHEAWRRAIVLPHEDN